MLVTEITDLVNGTLNQLGPVGITNLLTDRRRFFFLPQFIKKDKLQEDGGTELVWDITTDNSHQAENVAFDAPDSVQINNVMAKARVPWRHTRVPYAWDMREFSMNRGKRKLYNLIDVRRQDALTSLAEVFETAGWGKPVNSTDETTPYGVQMYIVPGATDSTETSFTGGNPAGFTSGVAGVDSTTNTRWRNWSKDYTDISADDAVAKIKEALSMTMFEAPVTEIPELKRGKVRRGIYAKYSVVAGLERVAEQQNDKLGRDLDSMGGVTVIRGVPLFDVSELGQSGRSDAGSIYGINWDYMAPTFLQDWCMHEMQDPAPTPHTRVCWWNDSQWNLKCTDRRRQFVLPLA